MNRHKKFHCVLDHNFDEFIDRVHQWGRPSEVAVKACISQLTSLCIDFLESNLPASTLLSNNPDDTIRVYSRSLLLDKNTEYFLTFILFQPIGATQILLIPQRLEDDQGVVISELH